MESKNEISMEDFRKLTKDVPDDYMLCFSLDDVIYGVEGFEVNITNKKIILK